MNILNRILLVLLILGILSSCGIIPRYTQETIIKGARIDLPVPPKPVGIKGKEGVTPDKYEIIEPPLVAESYQYWRSYKDGAIIWKPKDWRSIDEYIKSSQDWIKLAIDRINVHNKYFFDESNNTKKNWYKFWE
jgi:hypothetical protein